MLAASVAPWLQRQGIHYAWVMVGLTFLVSICGSAAISLPSIALLPIVQEFGWTRTEVSGALALMLALFGGVAPFGGALLLRFGLRRVVVVAQSLSVLGLLISTQISAPWHLWLSFGLLLGIAAGMTAMVLSATVSSRWLVQRRGLAVGILTAAFAAGQLTFLPLAAWLAAHYGWRAAVMPGAVGCSIAAALFFLFARDWPADIGMAPYGETEVQRPQVAAAGNVVTIGLTVLREAAASRAFWILAGTFFICGLSTAGTINQHFIPLCADQGISSVQAASLLAVIGVFNFVGTIGSGLLSDRWDCRLLLVWYYALRGLSLMVLPFMPFDLLWLSLFAVFFGLDYVSTVPPTVKLSVQTFGTAKGPIVFGWAFAAHQIGGAAASLATGVSRDLLLAYMPAFFSAGVACVFAVMALFAFRRTASPA